MANTLTFTLDQFSGESSVYPLREWAAQHPDRFVEFDLVDAFAPRSSDGDRWRLRYRWEQGSGGTARGEFRWCVHEFWIALASLGDPVAAEMLKDGV